MTNGVFGDVLRSEWTKLRSVRSTRWALLTAAFLILGLSVLVGVLVNVNWKKMSPSDRADLSPADFGLVGVVVAQLAVAVLGVLSISAEYRTGMIRTTLAAVPRRWRLLAAKGTVFAATTFVVALPACLVALLAGNLLLPDGGPVASLRDADVIRVVLGAALFLTVTGLFGLAIGVLVRHAAGAITTMVGGMFVLPVIMSLLPGGWGERILRYYPGDTGYRVWSLSVDPRGPGPWAGFALYVLWVGLLLAVGGVCLSRRDA